MKNIFVDLLLTVDQLVDSQNKCWNIEKLEELFYEEDINRILAMNTAFDQQDYWVQVGYWFINKPNREEEIRVAEARPSLNELKAENQARSGASWVVRDDRGKFQMHSQRAFSDTNSLQDSNYNGLLLALNSCHAHHLNRVILAIDDATLPNVILRTKAWPNFRCQYAEIMTRLKKSEWWKVMKEDRSTNTWAFLIAQSVIKGGYYQSYLVPLMAENVCCFLGEVHWLALC
ncbi:hypothetical protein Bca4012_007575 [Brassica carinata]